MNLYRAVGTVAQAWMFALRGVRRARTREPFVLVGGIQLILLIALGHFHTPALAGFLTPVVRWLGGEGATHYPDHFWALPEVIRGADTILAILFTFIAWGVATLRFSERAAPWSAGFRRSGALMGIGLLSAGTVWIITSLFDLIPIEITMRSFIIRMGFQGIELLMIVLVQSLLAYAIAFVLLDGRTFGGALAGSVGFFRQRWMTTFLLLALPAAILFPMTFFLFEMNMDEAGLVPEGVGMLLTVRLVIRVFFDVLVVGGLTFVFLGRKAESR